MVLRRILSAIRGVLFAAGGLLLIVTFTRVVPWTASHLSADWTDSDGDVLVLLAGSVVDDPAFAGGKIIGDSSYWRAIYGIRAWKFGHFQKVLLVGEGMAETVKPLLITYGVPEDAILVEGKSKTTHENALFAKPILAGLHGRFVLLTSDYHMLRASRCFAHEGIRVITRPIPDVRKRSNALQFRWQGFWIVAGELVKIAYYGAHRWI